MELYTKALASRIRLGPEASLCIEMDSVISYLKISDINKAKDLLEKAKLQLSSIVSSESVVFSKYYMASAEYRKVVGPPQEFYNAALMYLAYTPIEQLSEETRYILATDMALASITGEEIFNFGEVLGTPILNSLTGTPNQWLWGLVLSLHQGDIDQYNLTVDNNRDKYFSQPALSTRHESIKQKVVLISLMNLAFERSSNDRQISFFHISQRAKIPIDQVEWVLMRALSLGLIKGTIDQVDQVVSISWIQPRVLDKTQLSLLNDQLGGWTERFNILVNSHRISCVYFNTLSSFYNYYYSLLSLYIASTTFLCNYY